MGTREYLKSISKESLEIFLKPLSKEGLEKHTGKRYEEEDDFDNTLNMFNSIMSLLDSQAQIVSFCNLDKYKKDNRIFLDEDFCRRFDGSFTFFEVTKECFEDILNSLILKVRKLVKEQYEEASDTKSKEYVFSEMVDRLYWKSCDWDCSSLGKDTDKFSLDGLFADSESTEYLVFLLYSIGMSFDWDKNAMIYVSY